MSAQTSANATRTASVVGVSTGPGSAAVRVGAVIRGTIAGVARLEGRRADGACLDARDEAPIDSDPAPCPGSDADAMVLDGPCRVVRRAARDPRSDAYERPSP